MARRRPAGAAPTGGPPAAAARAKGTTVDDRQYRSVETGRAPLPPDAVLLPGLIHCRPDAAALVPFLETMPAAFCWLDQDWVFRYANAAAEALMGRPRAEVVGTSLWTTFPGMTGSVFEASYRSAVASGEPVTFEAAHPDADRGWFEVRAWPGPGGLAVYLLDVTARRWAENTASR